MSDTAKKEFILDDADRLMPISEVAQRLRTSPTFIGELIDAKLLSACSFKYRIRRVRKYALNKFLEEYDGQDLYEVLEKKRKIHLVKG